MQEWSPPTEVVRYEDRDDDGEDALGAGRKRPRSAADDRLPYVSQTRAFRDFLLRARHYRALDLGGGGAFRKLVSQASSNSGKKKKTKETFSKVLLDELPGFAFRNHAEFHSLLKSYARGAAAAPLVIVAGDQASSSSSGGKGRLLGEEAAAEIGAETVAFNPASATNLVRSFRAILTKEAKGPRAAKHLKVRL